MYSLLFKQLIGAWSFQRTILSQHSPSCRGVVEGTVNICQTNDNHELHYKEEGVFQNKAHQKFEIKREYFYCYHPEIGIQKYFSENQQKSTLFYTLKLTNNNNMKATANHLCGQDHYEADYDFNSITESNQFLLTYRIKGPKKEDTIRTVFKKST